MYRKSAPLLGLLNRPLRLLKRPPRLLNRPLRLLSERSALQILVLS